MNVKQVLLLAFLLCLGQISRSQEDGKKEMQKKQDFPIYLTYNNHSWAFPFGSVFRLTPHYPGATGGFEINYRVRSKTKLFQTIDIGGFLNNASGNAIYFNSNLAYRYSFKCKVHMDIGLGIGILNSYHINDIYIQTDSGNYISEKDRGVGALSNNLFLGIGYDVLKIMNNLLSIFVRYQWIASGAYWDLTTIRPNGLLHIGFRTSLRST